MVAVPVIYFPASENVRTVRRGEDTCQLSIQRAVCRNQERLGAGISEPVAAPSLRDSLPHTRCAQCCTDRRTGRVPAATSGEGDRH